jgi:hypothetical protein
LSASSPGLERALAEATPEALDPREADPVDLARLAVQHGRPGIGQDPPHLGLLPRLVLVVAQHGDDGHLHRRGQLLGEHPGLRGEAVVREIAAEDEDVGLLGHRPEERLERALRGLAAVEVPHRGHPDDVLRRRHAHASSAIAAVQRAISSPLMFPCGIRRASR